MKHDAIFHLFKQSRTDIGKIYRTSFAVHDNGAKGATRGLPRASSITRMIKNHFKFPR